MGYFIEQDNYGFSSILCNVTQESFLMCYSRFRFNKTKIRITAVGNSSEYKCTHQKFGSRYYYVFDKYLPSLIQQAAQRWQKGKQFYYYRIGAIFVASVITVMLSLNSYRFK